MVTAYYNEIDRFAAAWLRELIKRNLIAPGEVDERSIADVRPDDLVGFDQVHFFAGIGVWSYALRRAGWPDDRPVWTGSCPCQPFSCAGKGAGFDDSRHLWPEMFRLIAACRPVVVLGEQVASKDGLAWLDTVQADLEGAGYTSGAVDTCAAGFGAPHIRQRLYWMADRDGARHQELQPEVNGEVHRRREGIGTLGGPKCGQSAGGLADTEHDGCGGSQGHPTEPRGDQPNLGVSDRGHSKSQGQPPASPTNSHWRDADWLFCRDGKWRAVEPGTSPLATGVAARVVRLRGYGNSIVAPVAQAFIETVMEVGG